MFYKPMRFPEKLYENMRNLISDNETTNRDFLVLRFKKTFLKCGDCCSKPAATRTRVKGN